MGESTDTRCPLLGKTQSYLDDRLPEAEHNDHERHLESCPACRAELAAYRRVRDTLAEAAGAPLPRLDVARIERAVLERPAAPRRWLVPAFAATAAAAAVLLAMLLWPSDRQENAEPAPMAPRIAERDVPTPAPAPAPEAPAIERVTVALSSDARMTRKARADGGTEVVLEAGTLSARLVPPIAGRFIVRTPAGAIEATGTMFVVQVTDNHRSGVWLFEGTLKLTPASGQPAFIGAPAAVALHRERVEIAAPAKVATAPAGTQRDPLARIRRLLAERKLERATAELDRYLARKPGDPSARFLLGDAHRLAGRAKEALAVYSDVGREAKDARLAEAALYEVGRLELRALARPAAALETFEDLLDKHPRGLLLQEVFYMMGECHLALKNFAPAVQSFGEYLRRYPKGTKAREASELLRALNEKGWR